MEEVRDSGIRYCSTGDGVRIAYNTKGSGYPLLRALGWFTHLEAERKTPLWSATNDALSARYAFTRYDGRGTGLSDRRIESVSLETYLADLEAVADAVSLERFAILGISQGGAAAVSYAIRHPERVSHLILYGSQARPHMEQEVVNSLVTLVRLGWGTTPAVRELFTAAFIPGAGKEEMRWFNEFQLETASAEVAAKVIKVNLELDIREIASLVAVPTLVIHRRGDAVVPFQGGQDLASLIPGARFLPLDGENHLFLDSEDEDRGRFLAAIDEFVTGRLATPVPTRDTEAAQLRTVLFTDLVGHTEMMSRLGDENGRTVLREHERITREVLAAHGGTEVKTMGDGFMASFGSVTKAVECAIALQRAFAEHDGEPLNVRVGLNAGEPIEEDGDLFGATVILASRIAGKAEGGEILVSDTVRGLCSGKGFLFADRGEFAAKGFEEAVRVYEVRWQDG